MNDISITFILIILSYFLGFYYMFKGELLKNSFTIVLTSFLTYFYVYSQPFSQWLFLGGLISLQLLFVFLISFYFQKKNFLVNKLSLLYGKNLMYSIVILNLIFCLILVIKVPFGSLPWFSSDLISGRQDFNSGNSSILRIPKYILPFLNILTLSKLITEKKANNNFFLWIVVVVSSIISCLYEGSKSSFISYFVLVNGFFFIMGIKSRVLNKSKYILLIVGALFVTFTIINTIKSSPVGMDLGGFFVDRLLISNANSFEKVFEYVKYRNNYNDFLYSPFQIFLNNLYGNTEGNKYLFPSLGNYLESDFRTPGEYETLVPFFLEGYVAFGTLGAIFFSFFIFSICFKVLKKIYSSMQTHNALNCVFYYFVFYECAAIIFRGKLANSITSFLLTILPIYLLLYLVTKLKHMPYDQK